MYEAVCLLLREVTNGQSEENLKSSTCWWSWWTNVWLRFWS